MDQFNNITQQRKLQQREIDYIKCSEIDYVTKCILFVTR